MRRSLYTKELFMVYGNRGDIQQMIHKKLDDKSYFYEMLQQDCELDSLAVKMMEENRINGLLPFRNIYHNDHYIFRYEVVGEETLSQWMERIHRKREVMTLLNSLVLLNEEILAYFLLKNNVYIHTDYVIVKDNSCFFAYIPHMKNHTSGLLELTKNLIEKIKYNKNEDFTYLFDLMNAFGRNEITNMIDLKKWLMLMEDGGQVIQDESIDPEEYPIKKIEENEDEQAEVYREQVNNLQKEKTDSLPVSSVFDSFFDEDNKSVVQKTEKKNKGEKKDKRKDKLQKKGFFLKGKNASENTEVKEEKKKPQTGKVQKKMIINELDSADRTMFIQSELCLYLMRMSDREKYFLEKDTYLIGSGSQADIVISNNPAVSRRHARLLRDGDQYKIKDENSTNGTKLNGRKLLAGEMILLKEGDRLQLANEIFQVEKGVCKS